ncbi:MAG: elongation factor P [Rhodospirillaceae bacterium TMED8]|nr:elongation factor P [Magnetovibrio sp.]OUT50202.1 MAG: elongation factor P [Rhodospirillaceae bacterium TMED8]|tara:strand:- start:213 stop:782 length:570 start_codon:yes stop_codon:yes gene_type:complete
MKIDGNAIRPGMVIEHKGALWRAVKTEHTQPGKGGAYLQVELKEIRTGTKLNERFRSSEKVARATLEQREFQFLFSDGDSHTFMDNETYDQVSIHTEFIGSEVIVFLQDGMNVTIEMHEGSPIGIQLPDTIIAEVVAADAVVKGQTASSSFKPAVLDNGVKILVPPHIGAGTRVVVRTEDGTYMERAKD